MNSLRFYSSSVSDYFLLILSNAKLVFQYFSQLGGYLALWEKHFRYWKYPWRDIVLSQIWGFGIWDCFGSA